MKKKLVCLLIVGMMVIGMETGCGGEAEIADTQVLEVASIVQIEGSEAVQSDSANKVEEPQTETFTENFETKIFEEGISEMKVKEDSIVLPLPTEQLIAENEEDWNQKLPLDYKEFIMKYNGATPMENTFECVGHEYMVARFLCILENIKDTDEGWYDISVVESGICERLSSNGDFVGAEIIPIAELYAGDFLCIDFREDRENPELCVWDHEESGELEPVTYKVADSFTEFVSILK